MAELVPVVRDSLGPSYPELVADFDRILSYAAAEEAAFLETLRGGTTLFEQAVSRTRGGGRAVLAGSDAFRLHDTFGFPFDLTLEMAAEAGLEVDEEGFRRLMAAQRSRAQADAAAKKSGHADVAQLRAALDAGPTRFTGYEELTRESRARALLAPTGLVAAAGQGEQVDVVLDVTPFYAEAGGQLADTGTLRGDGVELEVLDVQRPLAGLVVHRCRVLSGELRSGDELLAVVDAARRGAISRSHTATHLVHRAFRSALGEAATQAGSENAPGRLRFDFHNPAAVPAAVVADVEDEVNAVLAEDLPVRWFVTDLAEARRLGALALFTEKYGEQVRVVEVGDYARELCGGTHVERSARLGLVKLVRESSIGAGVRRVEGLVGLDAFRFLAREHVLLSQLGTALAAAPEEVPDRVREMVARLREAERELEQLRRQALLARGAQLAAGARLVEGVQLLTGVLDDVGGADDLRTLALEVRGRLDPAAPGVVALGARLGERAALVVALTDEARARGLAAGALIRAAAPALGGGGGGRDDVAQGGGTRPEGLPAAMELLAEAVRTAGRPAAGHRDGG